MRGPVSEPIRISSLDDQRVELFRDVRDKDLHGRPGLFMAESELVLRRLLSTPERLHSLLLTPQRYEAMRDVLAAVPPAAPIYLANLDLMTQIAGFNIHRGVLAVGRRLDAAALTLEVALGHLEASAGRPQAPLRLLIAEGLTNVDNMGGLFRNATAFGADGVVLDPTCCDPLYRKAIRVSMGHALSVPYAECRRWPEDLRRLKDRFSLTLVGAELTADAFPLWQMPRAARVGLIFGSEGHGLSDAALELCDAVCQIPMAEAVPSLNVGVASAVFLYELQRPKAAM